MVSDQALFLMLPQ